MPGRRVGLHHLHRAGQPGLLRPVADLVALGGQRVARRLRDGGFDRQAAGEEVEGGEAGRGRNSWRSAAPRSPPAPPCRSCRTLSTTCSMAWICTSPPGVPKGITPPSSVTIIAGLGVSRGRLPGATPQGCARVRPALAAAVGGDDAEAGHHRRIPGPVRGRRAEGIAPAVHHRAVGGIGLDQRRGAVGGAAAGWCRCSASAAACPSAPGPGRSARAGRRDAPPPAAGRAGRRRRPGRRNGIPGRPSPP